MHILIYSHTFFPVLGGIESMCAVLADEFVRGGHNVTVFTPVPSEREDDFSFCVIRSKSLFSLFDRIRIADTVLVNNISVKAVILLIVLRRRFFVSHHTWIRGADGKVRLKDRLKQLLLHFCSGISVSNSMKRHISSSSVVIENCFDDDVFHRDAMLSQQFDVVFAGRLVHDKGVHHLLSAAHMLSLEGIRPTYTIVGDGPEREALEKMSSDLGLTGHVRFVGRQSPIALASTLRDHRVAVFPSVWDEPFGIVALEAAACGCFVIGSAGGGLADAIGPCGITYENGNIRELASSIKAGLSKPLIDEDECEYHLSTHTRRAVAQRYLEIILSNDTLDSKQPWF